MSERDQRKEVITFLRTSPDMAVVGVAHFSVNRNAYDHTDLRQTTDAVLAPGSRKNPPPEVDCIPWRPLHAVHSTSAHHPEGAGVR